MELLAQVKQINIFQVAEDLGFEIIHNRKIICPFHEEETPSMVFYPLPQNEFHCFGCGRHGDVINFYADVNALDFRTALIQLAYTYIPGYGIAPQKISPPTATKKIILKKTADNSYVFKPLFSEIYETFADYCLKLPTNELAKNAYQYLLKRGFSEQTIKDFTLFVIKDYALANEYMKTKFQMQDLQDAGIFNERGNLVFFKHPLIIPYFQNERIIYLQGRVIGTPPDGMNKYQFLTQIPRPIFNLDILKKTKTNRKLYITEGAIDCMTLVQNGYPAVSLGSANTFKKEWAKLFRRFEVIIYFDNDATGQQSAKDLKLKLGDYGILAEIKTLPKGINDVNEYFMSL